MLYQLLTKERRAEIHTTQNPYQDVSASAWYNETVSTMTKGGYIAGYPDGTFGGDRSITRADTMAIINRVLDRGVSQGSTLLSYHVWPDNDPTAWYYYEIIEATNAHEYTGTRPNENWTKLF